MRDRAGRACRATAPRAVSRSGTTFEGIEIFVRGTGRFTEATGRSFLEGTASIFTNVGGIDRRAHPVVTALAHRAARRNRLAPARRSARGA